MNNKLITAALLLLAPFALAQTPELRQIMADPEWMGSPVEQAWWSLDGDAVYYRIKRDESTLRDIHRIDLASGDDERLDFADHAGIDAANPVFHRDTGRAAFTRDGNLFVRLPDQDRPQQLTRTTDTDSQPTFGPDGDRILFRRGNSWWMHDLVKQLAWPVADLKFEDEPDAEPDDSLAKMQLRLFSSLREDLDDQRERRQEAERAAHEDPTRSPAPWYLGEGMQPTQSSLSPDGRWLLVAVQSAAHQPGRTDSLPHYVTIDGYIEQEEKRTRVGRNEPAAQSLWLLDLEQREKHELSLDELPGIQDDPLADLKKAQDIDPLPEGENRAVSFMGMQWHPDGHLAAVQVRANDNKDRWLAVLDPREAELDNRHRLTDEAWINWAFNDFGWLPDSETLWLLSEESGYSHFYTVDASGGSARAITRGDFEVMNPVMLPEGDHAIVLSNRSHPGKYDLYRLDIAGGNLERITEHRGIEDFAVLPGHDQILVRYSETYLPAQVGLVNANSGELTALTDTRTEEYRAIEWQMPEIVAVESSHGAGAIWSRFYPARAEPPHGGDRHPVVMFVHGAGYLQNVHYRYPQYFREQMFHNLLTERGYHVLDMDFRASAGYGRDWRTAIYRQMGTPELEDYIDGADWLIDNHDADPDRIGIYGGSYGGFMAFMALFNAPERFAAGAALRPVSDWAHYNHSYTSNILNTPEVDPVAYERSSPIEFAEGLEGHLLMTAGILDDNVFYQDVVRLAQRLLDLEKDNWELATYPLERHAFTRPESWRDQYQRILDLFERTIGGTQ
ncbi:prolyl oligopeptidase family serine peptidase [Wenzhouxiangella sp. AB-CW3]|uniref:prolyl oligopeptidase family serine peptidase n=1 Tax=Wenzhouxiangella sp. AB-CW3 TaxID=2771012 RepID=UPI00168AAA62|nr:prolyl oligopeptidase family serine peptidase [Wenzhouxiangella sp. AB-CW3]QOC21698.1 prolyl oligopeptidase family serine peptidase [Wenzhouxiangella sp. AB-CW3]